MGEPLRPSADRASEPHVTRCAWCGRYGVEGDWLSEDAVHAFARPGDWVAVATHGICPDCVADLRSRGLSR
jgi:hypothetical protein